MHPIGVVLQTERARYGACVSRCLLKQQPPYGVCVRMGNRSASLPEIYAVQATRDMLIFGSAVCDYALGPSAFYQSINS